MSSFLANYKVTQHVITFVIEATSRYTCSFLPPKSFPVDASKTAQYFADILCSTSTLIGADYIPKVLRDVYLTTGFDSIPNYLTCCLEALD